MSRPFVLSPGSPRVSCRQLVALLFSWCCAAGLCAQEVPDLPTAEAITEALAGLEELGLEEAARNELRALYQDAQQALLELTEWRARLQDYESKSSSASREVTDLRAALATAMERPVVTVPAGAGLTQMEQSQAEAQAELDAARRKLEELQGEARQRSVRRTEVAQELTQAREALGDATAGLQSLATETGESARAQRTLAQARWHLATHQERTLNAEIASYDARKDLLPLRTEQAARRVARAEILAQEWQQQVATRRTADATRAAEQAAATRREITKRFPQLSQWADRNEELVNEISGEEGVTARLEEARAEAQEEKEHLDQVRARYLGTLRKVRAVGTTEEMGLLLRREGERLDPIPGLERKLVANRRLLSQAQYQDILLEEERAEVEVGELRLQRNLVESASEDGVASDLDTVIRELVSTRKERLDSLIDQTRQLATQLGLLNTATAELLQITQAYRTYIDSRILWVPSVTGSLMPAPEHYWDAFTWLLDPGDWRDSVARSAREWKRHRVTVILLVLLVIASHLVAPFSRRRLVALADEVGSWRKDSFTHTLQALGFTFLVAIPLPLLLWAGGWFLALPPEQVGLGLSVGVGLMAAASPCLVLRILTVFLRPGGVAEAHLRWPAPGVVILRREVRQALVILVPLILLVCTMEQQGNEAWHAAVGRTAFVAAMVLVVLLLVPLRPTGPLLGDLFQKNPGSLLERLRFLWFPVAIGLPAVLALAAMAGYYATALTLARHFQATIGLTILLVVGNALVLRWLFLARRRLAVEQARQRAQARAEAEHLPEDAATESGSAGIDEESVSIPAVDAQTRQLVRSALVAAVFLGLFAIWANALPALRILERVHVWPAVGVVDEQELEPPALGLGLEGATAPETLANGGTSAPSGAPPTAPNGPTTTLPMPDTGLGASASTPDVAPAVVEPVTLANVGMALVILFFMFVAARNIPGLLEIALQRLDMDSGGRFALSTLLRYGILIVGSALAFASVGIGWNKVQWLAAALTFGLAFGLQEIFANFVSGLIILIERPIRVGDIVTVGDVEGRVTRLRMRATTILDWDRREMLVPNKEFITGSLVNWTLSDPVTRLVIPVGIAYGSDTKRARDILLGVARKHPLVLDDPKPSAIFRRFGDSSLDFELRVFMANRDQWPRLMDGLHSQIDDEFRKADIEIAFPQRDLHLRTVPEGLVHGAAGEPSGD